MVFVGHLWYCDTDTGDIILDIGFTPVLWVFDMCQQPYMGFPKLFKCVKLFDKCFQRLNPFIWGLGNL